MLDVDLSKRRISLGSKQCTANPWEDLTDSYPIGTEIEGEIRNITEFGLFVGLTEDIRFAQVSDISWETTGEALGIEGFNKDMIKAKVDIDIAKSVLSLSN